MAAQVQTAPPPHPILLSPSPPPLSPSSKLLNLCPFTKVCKSPWTFQNNKNKNTIET